jgi:3'-5' exoribonuclease
MKSISSFKEQDKIQSCYLVSAKSLLKDRNSKSYLSFNLNDKTGSINARIWDNVESTEKEFETGEVVFVKGHVQNYQGKLQFVVHQIRKADVEEFDVTDLVRSASKNTDELLSELNEMVAKMTNPNLKLLIENVLNEAQVKERLIKYPAARSIHHAYFGGLLEHIVSIAKTLEFLSTIHKQLNYDYLIFGAIFHDIGKLWELEIENGINYSNEGRLLGHMQLACELVDRHAAQILGFTDKLRHELKHIILSHHGRLEYGSPKRPKFLEALVVAMVDDLDSKINTVTKIFNDQSVDDVQWSSYDRNFDRYFYLDIYKQHMNKPAE